MHIHPPDPYILYLPTYIPPLFKTRKSSLSSPNDSSPANYPPTTKGTVISYILSFSLIVQKKRGTTDFSYHSSTDQSM
jgi:hypothetical protein